MLPSLSLVLGGARSGKSGIAEKLVKSGGRPTVYVATAEAWDDEMRARIAEHQARRGDGWRTVEAPRDLSGALGGATASETVLIDCATFWLSNHLMDGTPVAAETERFFAALDACAAPVVVVSNEVGWSVVPENALARAFRDAQGRLNQQLAERAGLVVAAMAGLPPVLKGTLPEGLS